MLHGKRILFFLPEDSVRSNGVYYSQIYSFAKLLRQDYHASVMIIHRDDSENDLKIFLEEAKRDGIELKTNLRPNSHLFIGLNTWYFDRLIRELKDDIHAFTPTHIYTRHPLAAYSARHIRSFTGAKLIYSLRGVWPEEKAASGRWKDRLAALLFQHYENRAVAIADELNTVSFQFQNYIKKCYQRESSVLPCCVSEAFFEGHDRAAIRRRIGFCEDDLVVAYCGSTVAYQQIDKTCLLLAKLRRYIPQLKCLFITTSKNIEEIAVKAGLPRESFRQGSGKARDVAALLAGADAGVILRAPSLINRVASPVKVGEYLASGLAIIGTDGIGDYSEILVQNGLGILADLSSEEEIAKFLLAHRTDAERIRRTRFARENYSWQSQHETIRTLFS